MELVAERLVGVGLDTEGLRTNLGQNGSQNSGGESQKKNQHFLSNLSIASIPKNDSSNKNDRKNGHAAKKKRLKVNFNFQPWRALHVRIKQMRAQAYSAQAHVRAPLMHAHLRRDVRVARWRKLSALTNGKKIITTKKMEAATLIVSVGCRVAAAAVVVAVVAAAAVVATYLNFLLYSHVPFSQLQCS